MQIYLANLGRSFAGHPEKSVLSAMTDAGVKGLRVGCRGGGCGVCRVRVLSGVFDVGCMSLGAVSDEDRRNGVVLACKLYPRGDLVLLQVDRPTQSATQYAAPLTNLEKAN